jgi:glucan phosphoethanolaminetransferase (alkaline phosphatase superfamily)
LPGGAATAAPARAMEMTADRMAALVLVFMIWIILFQGVVPVWIFFLTDLELRPHSLINRSPLKPLKIYLTFIKTLLTGDP